MKKLALLAAILFSGACAKPPEPPAAAVPPPPTEGLVEVAPGIRVHWRSFGSGPDTLVVVRAGDLSPQFERLAKGRRVILYDPRGRLGSDPVEPSQVSFENEIADLEKFREAMGLEKMQLLGWSHYGMATGVYAIRHPERVSRLVQMMPGTPARHRWLELGMQTMQSRIPADAWKALEALEKKGEFAGQPILRCRETKKALHPAFVGNPADAEKIDLSVCRLPTEWDDYLAGWWGALFGSMGDWDYREQARSLPMPRLVVHGEKDFIPYAGSEAWAEGNANARLLVMPGIGHYPTVEAPDAFFGAVETFLSGSWPEGAREVPAGGLVQAAP
jgi:pimeloyl-ACP methyl ester carboxylesterase